MTARRLLGAFLREERAVTSAEFALVVPAFIILIFATINGSIMMSAVNQMHYAAERTARCMAVDVGDTCDDVDTYGQEVYTGPSLSGLDFTLEDDPDCGKKVVGSGDYELFSGVSASSVSIRATACYPLI